MHEDQLDSHTVHCPYCSTAFDLLVDISQGSQETWEDCPFCCAPIQLKIEISPVTGDLEDLRVGRDDDVL